MSKKVKSGKSMEEKSTADIPETKRITVFANKNGTYSKPIIQIAEDCTIRISGGSATNGAKLNFVTLVGSSGEYKIKSSAMVTKGNLKVDLNVTYPNTTGEYSCVIEYVG